MCCFTFFRPPCLATECVSAPLLPTFLRLGFEMGSNRHYSLHCIQGACHIRTPACCAAGGTQFCCSAWAASQGVVQQDLSGHETA